MAKLPTVELKHRRSGRIKIINYSEYAADITKWTDWTVISEQRGDATAAEVARDAAEKALNENRRRDAERDRKFGDSEKAAADKRIAGSETWAAAVANTEAKEAAEAVPVEVEDWEAMKWPDARKYIKGLTGTFPRSKKEAAELVEAFKASQAG